jgi:phosphatidylglycerophosphate synthase
VTTPAWRDFRAVSRGGGPYSEAVSQPLGAVIAVGALRLSLSPNALSLLNVLIGLLGSASVLLPVGGLVALVAWQLAYAFDCADGQLARVTGRAGPAGARLDVLCDLVVQIGVVTALAAAARGAPGWLVAVFAGTWLVNLVTSVLASGPAAASLVPSRAPVVRAAKLGRDYGAVILLCGLVLAVRPQWTVWLLCGLAAVNGLFLVASVVAAFVRASSASAISPASPSASPCATPSVSPSAVPSGTPPAVPSGTPSVAPSATVQQMPLRGPSEWASVEQLPGRPSILDAIDPSEGQ